MGSSVEVFRVPRPVEPGHEWTCRSIRAGALHGPCDCAKRLAGQPAEEKKKP